MCSKLVHFANGLPENWPKMREDVTDIMMWQVLPKLFNVHWGTQVSEHHILWEAGSKENWEKVLEVIDSQLRPMCCKKLGEANYKKLACAFAGRGFHACSNEIMRKIPLNSHRLFFFFGGAQKITGVPNKSASEDSSQDQLWVGIDSFFQGVIFSSASLKSSASFLHFILDWDEVQLYRDSVRCNWCNQIPQIILGSTWVLPWNWTWTPQLTIRKHLFQTIILSIQLFLHCKILKFLSHFWGPNNKCSPGMSLFSRFVLWRWLEKPWMDLC